jgi:DNA polymerase I
MAEILLIDALNFIYKGKIRFGPKPETPSGPSYNIVYNFFRNLRALVEQFDASRVFFCSEAKNNFRYKLYPEYKANRIIKYSSTKNKKDNDDFERQRDIIFDLIKHLPIQSVKADGFEADDVIATLVEDLKDEPITIISGDGDFIQLLQKGYKRLRLYNPIKKDYIPTPQFHHLVFKALAGDTGDNIPGILSEKKALLLVNNVSKFKEFLLNEENRANYSLNKQLCELQIIEPNKLEFLEHNTNFDLLKEAFVNMEFASIIEEKYWNRFVNTFKLLEK